VDIGQRIVLKRYNYYVLYAKMKDILQEIAQIEEKKLLNDKN
jgi:hypothetical protein